MQSTCPSIHFYGNKIASSLNTIAIVLLVLLFSTTVFPNVTIKDLFFSIIPDLLSSLILQFLCSSLHLKRSELTALLACGAKHLTHRCFYSLWPD